MYVQQYNDECLNTGYCLNSTNGVFKLCDKPSILSTKILVQCALGGTPFYVYATKSNSKEFYIGINYFYMQSWYIN